MSPRALFLCAALLCACSDSSLEEDEPAQHPSPEALFSSAFTGIELEVDYEEGAQPFTGAAGSTDDVWDVSELNLDALFSGTKTLAIPHSVEEMEWLGPLDGAPFDKDELLDIAALHRDPPTSEAVATFYILFVDGFYEEDGEVDDSVVGIHFERAGVIAMFKPAIGDDDKFAKFVEQSTLIHEVGHAAGLVNDGLPLTADHHDAENGSHCTRTDCVMYYALEGKKSVIDFAKTHMKAGEPLFGPDCLSDAAAALR